MPAPTCLDILIGISSRYQRSIHPDFGDIPDLHCRWHINKNVHGKTKTWFSGLTDGNRDARRIYTKGHQTFLEEWRTLVESPTVDAYNRRWAVLRTPNQCLTAAIRYLENTWLWPWKNKFVRC